MASERYNLRQRPVRIIYREVDQEIQQRGIPVMNQEQHTVDAQIKQEQGKEANVNNQKDAKKVIQQVMAANNMFYPSLSASSVQQLFARNRRKMVKEF